MSRWSSWLVAILVIILAIGLYTANVRIGQLVPSGEEFLPCWAGVRIYVTEGRSPYGTEAATLAQEIIYGRPAEAGTGEPRLVCPYPTSWLLLLLFAGLFPLEQAWPLYITSLELGLLALGALSVRWVQWQLSPPRWILASVFSLVWYFGIHALLRGDPAVLVGVLLMASLLGYRAGHDAVAGISLALSTGVPGLALPLTLWILLSAIVRRRWNLLGWYLLAIGLVVGAYFALGDHALLSSLRNAVESARGSYPVSAISVVAGWVPSFSRQVGYVLLGLLFALQGFLWTRSLRFEDRTAVWTAAHTLVATALAFPSSNLAYQVLLILPLFLVFALIEERWGRWGVAVSMLGALAVLIAPWLSAASDPLGEAEPTLWRLLLPILCFVGLWWNKWWVDRGPRALRG